MSSSPRQSHSSHVLCPLHHSTHTTSQALCPLHHNTHKVRKVLCPFHHNNDTFSQVLCPHHHNTHMFRQVLCPFHHNTRTFSQVLCPLDRNTRTSAKYYVLFTTTIIHSPKHYTFFTTIITRTVIAFPFDVIVTRLLIEKAEVCSSSAIPTSSSTGTAKLYSPHQSHAHQSKTARIVPCSTINSRGSVTTAIVVLAATYSHTLTKTTEVFLMVTCLLRQPRLF